MKMDLFMLATELFVVLMVFAAQIIAVATTRKTLLFGVRVPEGAKKTKEAKKITANYVLLSTISTVILGAACFLIPNDNIKFALLSVMILPVLLIFVSSVIYVISWKKTKALKEEKGWKPEYALSFDTSATDALREKVKRSGGWYIASLLIVIVCFIGSALYLPYAPAELPTHWGPDGKADILSPNNIMTLVPTLVISIAMIVLMYLSAFIMVKAKLQRGGRFGSATVWQGVRYKGMMINYLGFICLVMSVMFGLITLSTVTLIVIPETPSFFLIATGIFMVIILIPMFYILIKAGQSGEKLPVENERYVENTTRSVTTVNDDKFWKLGMFYFNKNDPSLFVEQRFGTGTDFNYAKPAGILLALFFAALYIGSIVAILVLQ